MSRSRSASYALRFVFLIFTVSFATTCSDEDSDFEATQTLLSLDPEVIPILSKDKWVYATDIDGNLLDIAKVEGRERVILTSNNRIDKFNLTVVNGELAADGHTFISLTTYADIEMGATFDIASVSGFGAEDAGTVAFKINSYNGPEHGISISNRSTFTDYEETIIGNSYNAITTMYGLPSDVLFSGYRNGVPVYTRIMDVKDGDYLELDMNKDFSPFEHQRRLDFKGQNTGVVLGAYLDTNGNLKSSYFNLIASDQLKETKDQTDQPVIGYIDGFDIYDLYVTHSNPSGYTTYRKRGDIKPSFSSFIIPAFNYKILSNDLREFHFEFSEDFSYSTASFTHESSKLHLGWSIHAPQGTVVNITNVPREILDAYPMIWLDRLTYKGCTLTKIIAGDTYRESILRTANDPAREVEYYTFSPYR
ncbi:MAG: hypothetical protein QM762_18250 [Chryseolinea sp.]